MSSEQPPSDFQPSYGTCHSLTPECPVEYTIYGSIFNLPAMLFFTILYFLLLLAHLFLGLRYRTRTFTTWLTISTLMLTIGHASRVAMHYNPWSMGVLSLQICMLLWGPTFAAAGISIAFKHMVHYCGAQYCLLPARLIPWVFVGTDVASVLIQGTGGIIASVTSGQGNSGALGKAGEVMIIFGVCFQVANMLVCSAVMLWFLKTYRKAKKEGNMVQSSYEEDKAVDASMEKKFTRFAWTASIAFACVLIRCIYRVAEMAGGWANPIMRDETTFIVCDST
jgi:hypothetical protein